LQLCAGRHFIANAKLHAALAVLLIGLNDWRASGDPIGRRPNHCAIEVEQLFAGHLAFPGIFTPQFFDPFSHTWF
jgi:hypothetical protein